MKYLPSTQIFTCFAVDGYYSPIWELIEQRKANDDGKEFDFYGAVSEKIGD